MKKAEKQLHPHNYILSLNKRWLLPLMCSNPANATYDEWIEKFHTGSDEIGYISHGVLFFGLGYNQSSDLVSISVIWHQVT